MDHPSFVPPALIVNNEESGDIGENINESFDVVRIGRQTGLGLQNYAHRANGWQAAIGPSGGEHGGIIHTGY